MKKSTILIVNGCGYVDFPHNFSRQVEEETPMAPIGITFKKTVKNPKPEEIPEEIPFNAIFIK